MTDLNQTQQDYARFVPAVQTPFLSELTRSGRTAGQITSRESLNWLLAGAIFQYDWSLYSADNDGTPLPHAPHTTIIGDSGGYQIGKGRVPAKWLDDNDANVLAYRRRVRQFFSENCRYGVGLDVPAFGFREKRVRKAVQMSTPREAKQASIQNFEWFLRYPPHECELLLPMHGASWPSVLDWYQSVKHLHGTVYTGFAFGTGAKNNIYNMLRLLVQMHQDGLIYNDRPQLIHMLGRSEIEFAVILTVVKRAMRKHWNPDQEVTFDTSNASYSANLGRLYTEWKLPALGCWSMPDRHIDEVNDPAVWTNLPSPLLQQLTWNELVGQRLWDSYAYALLAHHNTWMQIAGIQAANRAYDAGRRPGCLDPVHEDFETLVNEAFQQAANGNHAKANEIIDLNKQDLLAIDSSIDRTLPEPNPHFARLFTEE